MKSVIQWCVHKDNRRRPERGYKNINKYNTPRRREVLTQMVLIEVRMMNIFFRIKPKDFWPELVETSLYTNTFCSLE